MLLNRLGKKDARIARKAMRSGWQRPVLMAMLWAGVALAFWYNFDRRFAALGTQSSLYFDPPTAVSADERSRLGSLALRFKKEWGLDLVIHAAPVLELPPASGPMVFIGRDTGQHNGLIVLPGHISRLLKGPDGDKRAFLQDNLSLCAGSDAFCLWQTADALARILSSNP